MQARVQETYYFNKDSNFYNRDNLIAPVEHQNTLELKELLAQSQAYYFNRFFKKELGTIVLPGLEDVVYDPYLVRFLMKTVPHDVMSHHGLMQHTLFERYMTQPVFWDILTTRNLSQVYNVNKKVGFASSGQVRNQGRFGTVYHSGINYVGLALEPNLQAKSGSDLISDIDVWRSSVVSEVNAAVYPHLVKTLNNGNEAQKPLLHSLFTDNSYVVSPNFYNYVDNALTFNEISFVELLLFRFIQRSAVSKKDVVSALQSYTRWSVMHQLYLLPALWLLAKN